MLHQPFKPGHEYIPRRDRDSRCMGEGADRYTVRDLEGNEYDVLLDSAHSITDGGYRIWIDYEDIGYRVYREYDKLPQWWKDAYEWCEQHKELY